MATITRYFRTALLASIVFALPGFFADGISQTRVGKTVEQVEKLAAVIRYIHLNAMDAGIVKLPEDYRWASLLPDIDIEHFPNCGGALKIIAALSTGSGQASKIRR